MMSMEVDVPAPKLEPTESGCCCRMRVPFVVSFFWCVGLEVGTRLIGLMHLLVSLCLLIVSGKFASDVGDFVGTVEDAEDHLYTTWYKIAVAVTLLTLVHTLLAITLLYASFKRSTIALRVWLVLMIVLFVASLVFAVFSGFFFRVHSSGGDIFVAILEGVFFFGILGYCILTVYSYYQLLRSSEQMNKPEKSDL